MRIRALLAALPMLFLPTACSSGSAVSSTDTDGGSIADNYGAPSVDAGGAVSPAEPDCFGKPRNLEGRCEAELLTDDLGSSFVWKHAASHGVVLVATAEGVVRVSSPQKAEKVDAAGIVRVAVAGENLVWAGVDQTILAAPLGDPRSPRALDRIKDAELLAGHGNDLVAVVGYWLWHIDVTGAKPATTLATSELVHSAAVDETYVYYFTRSDALGTAVSRIPLSGGTAQLVASLDGKEEGHGGDVAVTSSSIFFRTDAGVRSVSKTVRQAPKLVAAGKTAAVTADVDGSGAFWATTTGTIGRIYRADADGTNPRLLAELPFSAQTSLTTDETALYILDPTSRTLYRLPKH